MKKIGLGKTMVSPNSELSVLRTVLLGFESQLEMPTLSHFHIQMQNGKALASSKAWGWL